MQIITRPFLALLAVFVMALGVAACGDDSEEPTGGQPNSQESSDAGDKLIQKDSANASKTIKIGSKNFDEQYILGEIYAQALAAAGFKVEKSLDLGAEQVAFKALKSGDVDAYPEYTGTALTSFYRVKTDEVPREPQQAFDDLSQELKADKITAMPQTPFENTFKVTSNTETAEKYGNPKTLTEVAEKAPKSSISGFPECRQRTDCLLGLNETYNWKPKFVSSQGKYADLDAGQSEFTFGFSTDGQLSTDKYVTYEDDKSLFPPYFVTLLVRDDAAQKLGDAGKAVVEAVQEPLTDEVMQELNARVSIDKGKPEDVARQYLQEEGFIK